MKYPINLASQPFRRDRPILVASAAVGALLVITLGVLISLVIVDRRESAETRVITQKVERQMQAIDAQQRRLDAVLARPENAEVLERSLFLNALLYRKGISWTRIFADLEKTVPPEVRIISIRPQVASEGQVYLEMVVGTQKQEPVIELLRKLESSDMFGKTTVYTSVPPSQSEPLFRTRMSVNYGQKL